MTDQTTTDALRGPWEAVLSYCGMVYKTLDEALAALSSTDAVDIAVVRGTALPEDGYLPEDKVRPGDIAHHDDMVYIDGEGDPGRSAAVRWVQAQAMAAGLNMASTESAASALDAQHLGNVEANRG